MVTATAAAATDGAASDPLASGPAAVLALAPQQRAAPPHPLLMHALAIPPAPGFRCLGARVEHMLAPRDGLLSELITEALELPEGASELLLRFGAIHTCPVPPALPPAILAAMPAEEVAEQLARRQAAVTRAGKSSQARTPQRATQDALVPCHSFIRVHVHPKRFPSAYSVAWQDRVVADTPSFVVVSKPACVPAAATVDNLLESAPACAAQAIGHPQPLLVTHRLDQCTEGLLVLGKSREFVSQFNAMIKRASSSSSSTTCDSGSGSKPGSSLGNGDGASGGGKLDSNRRGATEESSIAGASGASGSESEASVRPMRKFYLAATSAQPPLGLLRHYLSTELRQPLLPAYTIAHEQAVVGSLLAELRVVKVTPVRLSAPAAALWGADVAHECLIELLTGRTHQIRAQLSACGCPLLGDSLYQPLASSELRQRLFAGQVSPAELAGARAAAGQRLLEEPSGGIGLQACRLEVSDACMGGSAEQPAVFQAGAPWWRAT